MKTVFSEFLSGIDGENPTVATDELNRLPKPNPKPKSKDNLSVMIAEYPRVPVKEKVHSRHQFCKLPLSRPFRGKNIQILSRH